MPSAAGPAWRLEDAHRTLGRRESMPPLAKSVDQKRLIQRQIERLVYGLYGLRDKEIAMVEEATRGR